MKDIIIKFSGRINRKAKVTLTEEQYNRRFKGFVEYLYNFCDEINWEIKD